MFRKKLYYSVLIPAVLLALRPVWAAEIHVSTWDELKSAVENGVDGAGAGGTIYLDKNIVVPSSYDETITTAVSGIVIDGQGNSIFSSELNSAGFLDFSSSTQTDLQIKNVVFENMGGGRAQAFPIRNSGTLDYINADFINNYVTSSYGASGGAITNFGTIKKIEGNFTGNHADGLSGNSGLGGAIYNSGSISNIIGDFTGNYANGWGQGGAIYNSGSISNIIGDFTGNYANGWGQGGAIYNSGSISNITGDFTGNYTQSNTSDAFGGAIYNRGMMSITNSNFYDNYAQADNGDAFGGAIYNRGSLTITADNGVSEFSGNKVIYYDENDNQIEDYEAIYNEGKLTLNAVNNGIIRFDDKINGVFADIEDYLSNGGRYDVVSDNAGGYYVYDGESLRGHLALTESGYMMRDYSDILPTEEVGSLLEELKNQGVQITQQGDDYHIVMDGQEMFLHKTEDGYVQQLPGSALGIPEITITGDESGRVVFNNEVSKMATISVLGTNVDVNAGTFYNSQTSSGGVVNINAGAGAEDSRILSDGTMNVADGAKVLRTKVGTGGTMNVVSGGYAEDTTIDDGGKLVAAAGSMLHNMLAGGGAELDIDMHSLLTGNIIIDAGAIMGGSYDYSKIFKDEVKDKGSLTLVGGLNDILTESSLINTTADKRLNLTDGQYVIGDGAQVVSGWDQLALKNNAEVKLEGDISLNDASKKIFIENGSSLDLAGHSPGNYTIQGSLNNDGMVTFSHVDDEADDVTTIFGNYKAYANAQMTFDIDPLANKSDLLRVDGDVSGTTQVVLNVLQPDVRPTKPIQFVEAENDDVSTGAYFDIYRVIGSAYKWNSLYQSGGWYAGTDDIVPDGSSSGYGDGDTGNMADDPDLEDDAVLPPNFPDKPSSNDDIYQNAGGASVVGEAVAYMGLPSAGLEQTRSLLRNVADKVESTKTYHQRCGGFYDCAYDGKDLKNVWVSPIYSYAEADSPYHYEADISGLEAGFDISSDVYNRLGVFASYRHGEYDFDGRGDDYYSKTGAETKIDSYILGLYHRYDRGRYWLMSSLFAGYEDVDMASQDGVKASTDGLVFGGGIMGGTVYALGNNLTLEPTLGAIYTQIDYDNVKDRYGKEAHYGKLRNLELEASLKLQKTYYRKDGFALVYLRPGVVQNIGSGDVRVTSLQKVDALENSTLGSLKAGGSLSLNENWSAYFEIGYLFGSGYKNAMMNAGLVYAF